MFSVQVRLIHHEPSSFCSPQSSASRCHSPLANLLPLHLGKGRLREERPPTQVLLGLPFFPLLPALGQKHNLPCRTTVTCRFTIKATRSYRLPLRRGSHKRHVPGFPCCSLGRKSAVFFSLPQTWLGNALCSLALANDAFPEEDARPSQNLGTGKREVIAEHPPGTQHRSVSFSGA